MKKLPPQHYDLFGQLLAIGDYVVFPCGTKRLDIGTVVRLTPKMIRICPVGLVRNQWGYGEYMKYPEACIKQEGAALTMYILSKSG